MEALCDTPPESRVHHSFGRARAVRLSLRAPTMCDIVLHAGVMKVGRMVSALKEALREGGCGDEGSKESKCGKERGCGASGCYLQ